MAALQLNHSRGGKRLLKEAVLIRKRAGRVRDMDVLLQFAATLSPGADSECLVQLLADLGARREKTARKLESVIEDNRKQTRHDLKRFEHRLQKHTIRGEQQSSTQQTWQSQTAANAHETANVLLEWPKLNQASLHPFHLQVKQLIDLLKLMKPSQTKLLHQLTATKNVIGEWHDWSLLASIAARVPDHQPCPLRKNIDAIVKAKLTQAVAVARSTRKQLSSSQWVMR